MPGDDGSATHLKGPEGRGRAGPLLLAGLAGLLLSSCGGVTVNDRATASAPRSGTRASPASDALCQLQATGTRPDQSCTPGALNPDVLPDPAVLGRTICKAGWTDLVRPSPQESARLKHQVLQRYGIQLSATNLALYELDHRLPLEIGGAPRELANLWPEPWEPDAKHPQGSGRPGGGAQAKDKIENRTKAAICNGRLSLAEGQRIFLGDWSSSA